MSRYPYHRNMSYNGRSYGAPNSSNPNRNVTNWFHHHPPDYHNPYHSSTRFFGTPGGQSANSQHTHAPYGTTPTASGNGGHRRSGGAAGAANAGYPGYGGAKNPYERPAAQTYGGAQQAFAGENPGGRPTCGRYGYGNVPNPLGPPPPANQAGSAARASSHHGSEASWLDDYDVREISQAEFPAGIHVSRGNRAYR